MIFSVIEEANWLTLRRDLCGSVDMPEQGFDAVCCLGNSFAHLHNSDGDMTQHKVALSNFRDVLKPGGTLIIDHRNFDAILQTGHVPTTNVYYNVSIVYSWFMVLS